MYSGDSEKWVMRPHHPDSNTSANWKTIATHGFSLGASPHRLIVCADNEPDSTPASLELLLPRVCCQLQAWLVMNSSSIHPKAMRKAPE
jgi:hypothetical protein